jgi:hypothetical protein
MKVSGRPGQAAALAIWASARHISPNVLVAQG